MNEVHRDRGSSHIALAFALSATCSGAFNSACSGARLDEDEVTEEPPSDDTTDTDDGGDVPTSPLRINEVAAAGTPTDWVELINLGDNTESLDGLFLTDDANAVGKGPIPFGISLASGEVVVIEVSDSTLGFKLGSDEEVHLSNGDVLLDSVDWAEGESPAGGSYARGPDGTFATATPDTRGAPNGG